MLHLSVLQILTVIIRKMFNGHVTHDRKELTMYNKIIEGMVIRKGYNSGKESLRTVLHKIEL